MAAKKGPKIPFPTGCLHRHLWMGTWKAKKMAKGQRASRTRSSKARIYIAVPPEGGWVGGVPGPSNGYRGKKG